jgi:hypothetical protein
MKNSFLELKSNLFDHQNGSFRLTANDYKQYYVVLHIKTTIVLQRGSQLTG